MKDHLCDYKKYRRGTHRCASPAETLERVSPYFPLFGITRIANITGLDCLGIPVVMVVRPNSRSLAVSQGKGYSLISAKVSGVMESIETYHAERFYVPGMLLSYEDMAFKYNIIDIDNVSRSHKRDFSVSEKIYWNKGHELISNQEVWLPHALIHTDFTMPPLREHDFFISDTNGLASGNTKLEAINHAMCEIVERDALALWQEKDLETKKHNRIDPNSIRNQNCRKLIEKFQKAEIHFGIWDITTDTGIPVFICKMVPATGQGNGIRPVYGSGCHPDRDIALSRAITEAAQSRLTFISGSRDDQYKHIYKAHLSEEVISLWTNEILDNNKYKQLEESLTFENEFLEQDRDLIIRNLQNVGIKQIAVVDLTREEFGIPVVKVVIPGLESITNPAERIYGHRMARLLENKNQDNAFHVV